MIRDITRGLGLKTAGFAATLCILGMTAGGQAVAGCADGGALTKQPSSGVPMRALKPTAWTGSTQFISPLQQAVYHPDADGGRFLQVSDEEWGHESPIVGMWRFELLAPDNTLVDDGYAQWHSDHTEIQNSGVHSPPTSNFCLGVWEKVGNRTYQLNHFPLGWDAAGQASAVAIRLTETVKLTDDDHMVGTFTLKVYPWDSTKGLEVSGPPVQTVTGTIKAERVTIHSTVPGA